MIGLRMYLILLAAGGVGPHVCPLVFETPSDDRWHYPFNLSVPGGRPTASCFGSTSDPKFTTFNDRDGILLIAWRTDGLIPSGLSPEDYEVRAIRVTLTHLAGADWPVDRTPDAWFDMDFPITDRDAGQPIELFGVGFGPVHTFAGWTEASLYIGGDQFTLRDRDPYPFVFDADGTRLHAEDNVKDRFTPAPWAIGCPEGYVPGTQSTPFPVHFDVDLALSDGRVERYFQEQLAAGRLMVAVTSLRVTFKQAPGGFPVFFTKDALAVDPNAVAPRLAITLAATGDADGDQTRSLADVPALVECLSGPGNALNPAPPFTPEDCLCIYDFDNDQDVDFLDVQRFVIGFDGS